VVQSLAARPNRTKCSPVQVRTHNTTHKDEQLFTNLHDTHRTCIHRTCGARGRAHACARALPAWTQSCALVCVYNPVGGFNPASSVCLWRASVWHADRANSVRVLRERGGHSAAPPARCSSGQARSSPLGRVLPPAPPPQPPPLSLYVYSACRVWRSQDGTLPRGYTVPPPTITGCEGPQSRMVQGSRTRGADAHVGELRT